MNNDQYEYFEARERIYGVPNPFKRNILSPFPPELGFTTGPTPSSETPKAIRRPHRLVLMLKHLRAMSSAKHSTTAISSGLDPREKK